MLSGVQLPLLYVNIENDGWPGELCRRASSTGGSPFSKVPTRIVW